ILQARIPKLRSPCDAPVREDGSFSDANLHLGHEYIRLCLGLRSKAMYEPTLLQVWTKSPPAGRYWIVEHCGSTIRPVGGKDAHDHLKYVFERERGNQRLLRELDLADGSGIDRRPQSTSFTDLKPWLERTGREQTFQGVDRELLR
ncbi:hypothetical protein BKA60DRAFT_668222, partial [Fusarium oxysporum]